MNDNSQVGDTGEKESDLEKGEKDLHRAWKRAKKNCAKGDDDDEDDYVWAKIPKEILKLTTLYATRMNFSHSDHFGIICEFLKSCRSPDDQPLDLDQFPLSISTSYRKRKEVIHEKTEESRRSFREEALRENWPLFVHPDTKALSDTIGPNGAGIINMRERLAVVVTSPMFEGAKFVCAPGLEGGRGVHQAQGAITGLNDLGVMQLLVGVNYDTTASMTSPAIGTVALIEEEKGEQILKIPCRHHQQDLFGKNCCRIIVGRSVGPGNPLFIRFSREWPQLAGNIDYNNLITFDVGPWRGTFVEQLVIDVSVWARHALLTAVFGKRSWYDLLAAIVKFLGADPPNFQFKFKKPKPGTNARFGETAEYFLNLSMLARQLPWLSPLQHRQISDMAFISALFYGPDLLKSSLGARAVYNDLSSMLRYRQLRNRMPQVAEEALSTWDRHLDSLTGPHVITALVDDDWSDGQRQGVARALLQLLPHRVLQLPPSRVQYPGPGFCRNPAFWPVDDSLPVLFQFVTGESFLIFNILEVTDEELREWLEAPVREWSDSINSPHYKRAYHTLKLFAQKTDYTNDAAER